MLRYITRMAEFVLTLTCLACSVLDLDAFERCNKAEGLGVSDGTTQAKNMQDTINTCKLFRFLQLLCEGHNLGRCRYIRDEFLAVNEVK
jgi:ryanodine receptor 2